MEKRSWPIILIILCFILMLIYIALNDINYRLEKKYQDIQIDTYMVYSDWYRFIGSLRGILNSSQGMEVTLSQIEDQRDLAIAGIDDLRVKIDFVDAEIQNPLEDFIQSIEAGMRLGQEILDNGTTLVQQPDFPLSYKEGRIGIVTVSGKDVSSIMGPLASYQYFQLVRRLKNLSLLFDEMYFAQLDLILASVTERAKWVSQRLFYIRFSLLTVSIMAISLLILKLFQLNRYLHKLAMNTRKELYHTKSHLNEVQGYLQSVQFQQSLFEMVAGISHELNTPLGNCMTMSSHMEDSCHEFQESLNQGTLTQKDFLEGLQNNLEGFRIISENLDRMKLQIDTFKQLSSVNHQFEGSTILLQDYIKTELPGLSEKFSNTIDLQLENRINDPVKIRYSDLNQIFSQLMENSISHGQATFIRINFSLMDNALQILFEDNGTGVSEEQLSHIAAPFYTTDRGGQHMGLGLSILVSLINNKLQGKIDFIALDKGFLVQLNLPLKYLA